MHALEIEFNVFRINRTCFVYMVAICVFRVYEILQGFMHGSKLEIKVQSFSLFG